jgi:hypothetical protein
MALQSAASKTGPNVNAWRHALASAAALWLATAVVLFAVFGRPLTALSFVAPMALGAGVVAVIASRLSLRLPLAAYPLLVLGIAAAANAPVLGLLY